MNSHRQNFKGGNTEQQLFPSNTTPSKQFAMSFASLEESNAHGQTHFWEDSVVTSLLSTTLSVYCISVFLRV